MKKRISYILVTILCMFTFCGVSFAKCQDYGNSGEKECINSSEDGYKCEYNISKKGAARCYKGKIAVEASDNTPTEDNNTSDTSTEEKTCNMYASSGESVCVSQSYGGYKCAWDINKKGGARCYQSKILTDEKINEIVSSAKTCSDIKEGSEVCNNAKVNGVECFYKQGVCANKTDSDGSGETSIKVDNDSNSETNTNSGNNSANSGNSNASSATNISDIDYIGDNFCETKEVLSVIRMIGYILLIAKLVAPIIIIVLGTIKFYNSIKEGTSDSTLKNAKSLIVRVFVGIFIFFLPTLIHAVLYNFIPDDSKNCEMCLLKPGSCDPDSGSVSEDNYPSNNNSNNECINKCSDTYTPGTKAHLNCVDKCSKTGGTNSGGNNDNNSSCTDNCNSSYTPGTKAHLDCVDKCSGQSNNDTNPTMCSILNQSLCTGVCEWKNGSCVVASSGSEKPACSTYDDILTCPSDRCNFNISTSKCEEKPACSTYDMLTCPSDRCKFNPAKNACENK